MLGGAGLGFSFVPVTIAGLTGVDRSDAGIASGLINTSRQIGGAVGVAAMSAIAAASTTSYVRGHGGLASTPVALDHGFQTALYAMGGLLLFGVVLVAVLIRPARPAAALAREGEEVALDRAA